MNLAQNSARHVPAPHSLRVPGEKPRLPVGAQLPTAPECRERSPVYRWACVTLELRLRIMTTSAEADGLSRTSRFHPHSESETPAPRAREPRSSLPRRAASASGSAAWRSRQTHKRAPREAVSFSSDGRVLLGARRAGACPLKPSRGLVPSFLLLRHPPQVAVDHAAGSGWLAGVRLTALGRDQRRGEQAGCTVTAAGFSLAGLGRGRT